MTIKKQRCLRINALRVSLGMAKIDLRRLHDKSNTELQKMIIELLEMKGKETDVQVVEENSSGETVLPGDGVSVSGAAS